MVAKISVGNSLYGAIAYNGEKINEAQGRLLTTNRIYNDGSGKVDINKAMEGFLTFMPPQMKVEKPVVHISLNPHPEDALTDAELQDIAREYLEKLGFGNQPYLVFKHEDIDHITPIDHLRHDGYHHEDVGLDRVPETARHARHLRIDIIDANRDALIIDADVQRSAARIGERDDRLDRARAHFALELYGLPFPNVHIPILLFTSTHI